MLHTSTPVSAFCELDGPQQSLPLLTHQTEMFCPSLSFILITLQEEMSFSSPKLMGHTPSCIFNVSSRSTTPITSHQPTPKVANESKIPKPEGEVGQLGCGGYSLETALSWDAKRFKKLKDCLQKSIEKHCDISKSKKHQDSAAPDIVKNETLTCFSELQDYEGCWPVGDIIQMQLKNTSTKE
ncbi:uncharacterized protein BJ212DRAFT_1302539 [Suillus subaureus]|uniref:Uncharacterized protein n=1 Tax=Suillus subaureus TaxID=48587 RepID=A0A9P7J920_9AGAM|nr:uncharacterized protein BJ212DRAFT_1302539 [Suillus subaureus]KAG1809290.1 hypothetical protein BJ212DRAFT_1302539 [Suillus subaureus]